MYKLIVIIYFIFEILNFSNCSDDNSSKKLEKIVNGDPVVDLNEAKYYVSLSTKPTDGTNLFCGGTVIDAKRILTAAHCVKRKGELRPLASLQVIWGPLSRFERSNITLIFGISKIIIHKDFDEETLENDIALLLLETPFGDNHLASQGAKIPEKRPKNGEICIIMGFGYLNEKGAVSLVLNKVDIQVISNTDCSYILPHLSSKAICAGNQRDIADSCGGDSGGPMFCNEKYVSGIVSYGRVCGAMKEPGVYTDVAAYKDWIKRNSANNLNVHILFILFSSFFSILISYGCYLAT